MERPMAEAKQKTERGGGRMEVCLPHLLASPSLFTTLYIFHPSLLHVNSEEDEGSANEGVRLSPEESEEAVDAT